MKRAALLLVAVLGLAVASSAWAADVNFKFFSQTGNSQPVSAGDVHFTLLSPEGDVAYNNATAEGNSVPAGDYTLVAEDENAHLFGSTDVTLSDDDQDEQYFKLSNEGLEQLDAPPTDGTGAPNYSPSNPSPANLSGNFPYSDPTLPPGSPYGAGAGAGAGGAGAAGAAGGLGGALGPLAALGAILGGVLPVALSNRNDDYSPASRVLTVKEVDDND